MVYVRTLAGGPDSALTGPWSGRQTTSEIPCPGSRRRAGGV